MATKKPSAPGKTTKAEPKATSAKTNPNKGPATKETKVETKETKTVTAAKTAPKAESKAVEAKVETKAVEQKTTQAAAETKAAKAEQVTATTVTATKQTTEKKAYSPEEVALRAYFLWLERGAQHGGDAHDWLRAEAELNHNK